jgi:peptidoglycan/xylan/chitin deacetylase (PgdA/CDA1 family)
VRKATIDVAHVRLDRGVFTLSLDFELIWGTLDLFGVHGFERACEIERAVVIERLLILLAEFEIPATWCVLGHLFLGRCQPDGGRAHPDVVRPNHSWRSGDWFAHDTGGDEASRPIFYGRSLVERIRACRVPQEIGCHSFSHVIFGDAGCSRETAESEITTCVRLAREMDLELVSFAFPRNSVGHLDVLRRHGFKVFRGAGSAWYEKNDSPGVAGRLAHLWDVLRATEPTPVTPVRTPEGLINIPGSMIYMPSHGVRRFIPVARRVERAIKGIAAAISQKRVFHLWFHPTNLADNTDAMFDGLRQILEYVARQRERGDVSARSMRDTAALCFGS